MSESGKKYPYRVFISYSHSDRNLVEKIVSMLISMGLVPLWDKDIRPGNSFTNEIKELISQSHIFIPLITPQSYTRPWVHQETGFAIALDIPILPISIAAIPSEMIAEVQAINVREDLSDLIEQLEKLEFEQIVVPKPAKPFGPVQVAESAEDRIEYLIRYANWVIEMGKYGIVRTQARFTIFGVPDVSVDNLIWDEREGNAKRSKQLRSLQLQERRILERHARIAGCRLIIDPTSETFDEQGESARKSRLNTLLDFLKNMPADKVELVISPHARDTSLTIVGDYFMAESKAARLGGYIHTVFNSHPPTVLRRIRQFDQLFNELQIQNKMTLHQAIEILEKIIEDS